EPLISLLFQKRDRPAPFSLNGLRVEEYKGNHSSLSSFEWLISFEDLGESICMELKYLSDLYDERDIQTILSGFQTLARDALSNPDKHLSKLAIADMSRTAILEHPQNTFLGNEKCVQELFEEQVQRSPNAPAIYSQGTALTYL